jgi:hypothetical protein
VKRIVFMATLALFALAVSGLSQSVLQTFPRGRSYRRIPVNARTIAALPTGKKFTVDLTKRGVIYVFNHEAGPIDFSRITLRNARGEVDIASFLQKRVLKERPAQLKYASRPFILGTQLPGTLQNPSINTTGQKSRLEPGEFSCDSELCICSGEEACADMLDHVLCTDWDCYKDEKGQLFCACLRP